MRSQILVGLRALLILVTLLALLPAAQAYAALKLGEWKLTGGMGTSRVDHTATLLRDGTVLVAGGSCTSSAELYNPRKRTWKPTGNMSVARSSARATLLMNGKVLVVGGDCPISGPPLNETAELFDPAAGTWSAAGTIPWAQGRTITSLQNGKVLVAGGIVLGSPVTASMIYDPATSTWSSTGSLQAGRGFHTATLLANGEVLVTGGQGPYIAPSTPSTLASAELYDPATGTWSTTGSLTDSRTDHTATLLANGKVLVAGGYHITSALTLQDLASAEIYDPSSGSWGSYSSMATARGRHTATLLPNGQVLVAGGKGWATPAIASAELYDPRTGTWSAAEDMKSSREGHTATLLVKGRVLVAGGRNSGGSAQSSAESYKYHH